MFNSKKSPAQEPLGSPTVIARGTTIRGDLTFSGAMFLEGRIEGTVRAEGDDASFTQTSQGVVHGEIQAPSIVLNGEVHGDVHASERLQLGEGARVEGNIFYKVLQMDAGARVNGKMVHQAEAPKRLTAPGVNTSAAAAEPA
jgi:cytoskeletal protein CcmA (bactofilin family)